MTYYEFILPIVLAVPVSIGVWLLRREAKSLDDQPPHPAE